MDVHAVDDETLEPIGRPTFTVAIDDFTRCVLGFFLTLLPPSALAAAQCLQRMRFPKEAETDRAHLASMGDVRRPEDRADRSRRDFIAPAFAYGCRQMDADTRTRPIAQPRCPESSLMAMVARRAD